MKKIIALAVILVIAISMVSIGAWAYFTDTQSSNAIITAGTLDLLPSVSANGTSGKYAVTPGGNKVNGYVNFVNIIPGESGNITWTLVNNGSLPGTLNINSTITFSDVSQNEVESAVPGNNYGSNGDLDNCTGIKLQYGVGADQATAEANFTYLIGSGTYSAAFGGLEAVLDACNTALAANGGNDTVVFKLTWNVNSDVKRAGTDGIFGTGDDFDVNENILQSDSAQIDITFVLNQ
jgi:predicted ribosomally synthesized peptide with SipW-like signal peptide